jgi:hypothetical protein
MFINVIQYLCIFACCTYILHYVGSIYTLVSCLRVWRCPVDNMTRTLALLGEYADILWMDSDVGGRIAVLRRRLLLFLLLLLLMILLPWLGFLLLLRFFRGCLYIVGRVGQRWGRRRRWGSCGLRVSHDFTPISFIVDVKILKEIVGSTSQLELYLSISSR